MTKYRVWKLKIKCIVSIIRGEGVIHGYHFTLPTGANAFFDAEGGHLELDLNQKGIITCNVFEGGM